MELSCRPPASSFFSHISPVWLSVIVPSPLLTKRGVGVVVGGAGVPGTRDPEHGRPDDWQAQWSSLIHTPCDSPQNTALKPLADESRHPVTLITVAFIQQPMLLGVCVAVALAGTVGAGVFVGWPGMGVLIGVLVAPGGAVGVTHEQLTHDCPAGHTAPGGSHCSAPSRIPLPHTGTAAHAPLSPAPIRPLLFVSAASTQTRKKGLHATWVYAAVPTHCALGLMAHVTLPLARFFLTHGRALLSVLAQAVCLNSLLSA